MIDNILEIVSLLDIAFLVKEVEETQAYVWRRGDAPPFLYDLLAEFQNEPWVRCFALRDPTSADWAGFVTTLPHDDDDSLEVGPLYVCPACRGRGLGKRALEELIGWVAAQGVRTLYIATWGDNARARHVFESVGFVWCEEIPDARFNGDSTVMYRLGLR